MHGFQGNSTQESLSMYFSRQLQIDKYIHCRTLLNCEKELIQYAEFTWTTVMCSQIEHNFQQSGLKTCMEN